MFACICVARAKRTIWHKFELWNVCKSWCVTTTFTLISSSHLMSRQIFWKTGRNEGETAEMTNWSCFLFLLRDDDEEVGERAAQRQNNRSVLSYFSAPARGGNQNSPGRTHRFFSDRRLKSLDTLWRQKRILHLSDAPTHRGVFPGYWWNSKYFPDRKAGHFKQCSVIIWHGWIYIFFYSDEKALGNCVLDGL